MFQVEYIKEFFTNINLFLKPKSNHSMGCTDRTRIGCFE